VVPVTTAISYAPLLFEHDAGPGHPERRERLDASLRHLQGLPWFSEVVTLAPRPAEPEWIRAAHTAEYVQRAEQACRLGMPYLDVPDVGISACSYEAALLSVGTGLTLADQVMAGTVSNGFALVRPPGHHAEAAMAMGFCLFNNAVILARYLQQHHGLDRILILDWDVHHGNGTQHAFEEDPSVFYVSLHQYPYYPGTGAYGETGEGRGRGATLNCPMPAGQGDADYEQAFMQRILPAVRRFAPECVIVSAGFDAHRDDPLGDMRLSSDCFAWMSARLLEVAERHAGGRLLSLLEGGYNVHALPGCIAAHLAVLAGHATKASPA